VSLRVALCWTGVVPLVVGIGAIATRIFGRGAREQELGARARIASLLAEGAGSEGLSETQLGFADRVFTMRGITLGQEMRAWREVAWIPLSATPQVRGELFESSGVSRMPVLDDSGRVVGIIAAIDHIGRPRATTAALLRPTSILSPSSPSLEAIALMRRDRVQLAVVADRPDRPIGIVTMKDLVEPLVGDLAAW
jgi:CBS domain containing-hemolysin-like protein